MSHDLNIRLSYYGINGREVGLQSILHKEKLKIFVFDMKKTGTKSKLSGTYHYLHNYVIQDYKKFGICRP